MSEKEVGPIYGVELIDTLPLDGGTILQALPSRRDLDDVLLMRINGRDRVVAGYEVLLEHYYRATARISALESQVAAYEAQAEADPDLEILDMMRQTMEYDEQRSVEAEQPGDVPVIVEVKK